MKLRRQPADHGDVELLTVVRHQQVGAHEGQELGPDLVEGRLIHQIGVAVAVDRRGGGTHGTPGADQPVELLDMIATLEKHLGQKAIRNMKPMQPGDVEATYADVDALTADVGFKPATSIDVGVGKFVEWYREYHQI